MAGGSLTGRDQEVIELGSVPGFVVFDLPGAPVSAGGTRLAPDVSVAEVALLARAMTYKFAALGEQIGGAKAGVRGDPADRAGKAALMARFCAEVASAGRCGPVPDRAGHGHGRGGFRAAAGAPRRARRHARRRGRRAVRGPADRVRRRRGRGNGADAPGGAGAGKAVRWPSRDSARWAAGWRVRSPAAAAGWSRCPPWPGCVADPAGLDVELLLALRRVHGDACVARYGLPVGPPGELFTAVDADVMVPGTRPGVIGARTAAIAAAGRPRRRARGERALHRAGSRRCSASARIVALPDFVCNAGAVIGYRSAADATPARSWRRSEPRSPSSSARRCDHQAGPLAGACEHAGSSCAAGGASHPSPPFARLAVSTGRGQDLAGGTRP